MNKPRKKCSICKRPYSGLGNNAEPINHGRCCDDCDNLVIARRIKDVMIKRGVVL